MITKAQPSYHNCLRVFFKHFIIYCSCTLFFPQVAVKFTTNVNVKKNVYFKSVVKLNTCIRFVTLCAMLQLIIYFLNYGNKCFEV